MACPYNEILSNKKKHIDYIHVLKNIILREISQTAQSTLCDSLYVKLQTGQTTLVIAVRTALSWDGGQESDRKEISGMMGMFCVSIGRWSLE